jgi:hypothetical protein
MQTPPKFDEVDWVELARSMGIYIAPLTDSDLQLSVMDVTERQALAEYLAKDAASQPRSYVSDYLDDLMCAGNITSFDKGCIRLIVNRLLR